VFQFTAVNGKRRVGPGRKLFGHDAGIVSTGLGIYNVQIVSGIVLAGKSGGDGVVGRYPA
jgi:hypothetical protein